MAGPTPVELRLADPDVDANPFALKPADLAVVAKLTTESVKQAALDHSLRKSTAWSCDVRCFLMPRPMGGDPT